MTRALAFLGEVRPAFVAHLAERLTESLCASSQALADAAGLKAPIRTHSVLLFLLERGPASLVEMARSDGQSHQLLSTRLEPLKKLGLIQREADPHDRRRHPYSLTPSGRREALTVRAAIGTHARAMEGLFLQTGVNLVDALDDALEALRGRTLADRIKDDAGSLQTRKREVE